MFRVDVKGLEEVQQMIRNLSKLSNASAKEIEKDLEAGARIMQQEWNRRVPLGPTRNLQKSGVVKSLQRRPHWAPAPVIFAIDRAVAPHAHIVEKGTKERVPSKKKVLANKAKGWVFGKKVAKMPKTPVFERTVQATQERAITEVMSRLGKRIDEAVK